MKKPTLDPEQIAALRPGEIPFLHLPDRATLFAQRAARLQQLAVDHPLGDFLRVIARIATAQQRCLDSHPALGLPSAQHIQHCHEHGMPPLGALALARDGIWRDTLRQIIDAIHADLPGPAAAAASLLRQMSAEELERQANALLSGETQHLDPASAPMLGAALQVYWVQLVAQLGAEQCPRIEPAHLCPACGSRPVANVVRIGAAEGGYRYLHCSLCSTEWHMVRIKCSNCESTKGIAYQHLQRGAANQTTGTTTAETAAVKAETCDECKSYAKIVYMDIDPQVEPTADDLASLTLDILVDELGYLRSAPNLMLIHAAT